MSEQKTIKWWEAIMLLRVGQSIPNGIEINYTDEEKTTTPLSDIMMKESLRQGRKITYAKFSSMDYRDFYGFPNPTKREWPESSDVILQDCLQQLKGATSDFVEINDGILVHKSIKVYDRECPCGLHECEYHLIRN